MNCEDFGKYLDNYETLTEFQKSEMNKHASECAACRAELDFFLSMLEATRTLPKIEPPEDFMLRLNDRLDAEDRKAFKPSKVVYHIQKNWKQYATAAACFALIAVLTANRGVLLDRIEGTEDGVITEDKYDTSRDNAAPDGTEPTIAPASPDANQTAQIAGSIIPAAPANSSTADNKAASGERTAQRTPSANNVSGVSAPSQQPSAPAAAIDDTPAEPIATPSSIKSEGYVIALGGNIQNESVAYEARENKPEASDYSIAVRDDSLAIGRYYRIDKDGTPIDEDNEPKAIGSLNISSSDADKAMDVIRQYPHGEDGDYYTTDSANFTLMLSMLSSEGISYTNYTPAGSGEVKFKIVFN